MIEISINKGVKNYGFKNILNEINIEIKRKEITALIGSNGSGKSTILKILAGIENLNSGKLAIRKNAKIGLLPQIPKCEKENTTVREILDRNAVEYNIIKERYEKYEKMLTEANEKNIEKIYNKFIQIQEEFLNTKNKNEIIGKIIENFKLDKLLDKEYNKLSGGEKTITTFASLMIQEPDILLLDEPTNHLDIETMEWLEYYLKNYNGTIVIVSHDRYFLDKVSTKTILIEKGKEIVFNGNYSYYIKSNEERILNEFKNFKDQQKQIKAMKNSVKKLREYGHLAGDSGGENFFKRAKAIEKRIEKIEHLDKPDTKKEIPLKLQIKNRSGNEVIKIKNLVKSYDKQLFNNAELLIRHQEKVCLMGPNGSGKTTLINEIINNNDYLGSNVKIGYIPQEIRFEEDNISILEEAKKHFYGEEQNLRSLLFKFMFYGENIHKKLHTLSGGEKVRLKLFILMQEKANLLILDEPTNHLDIETREVLEDALTEYTGTIFMVSHDRYFINKVATKIINIECNKLVEYHGNYEYMSSKKKQNKITF